MVNSRIEWLDVLKGIGIFAVILGHCVAQSSLPGRAVNSFHMPLFFFISGYLFMPGKTDYKGFIFKKLDSLFIPYCVYSILSIGVCFVIDRTDVQKNFVSFLTFGGVDVTWFLACLFLVEVIGARLLIKQRSVVYAAALAGLAFAAGYAYNLMKLPYIFCLRAMFYGLSFWLIGYTLKSTDVSSRLLNRRTLLIVLTAVFLSLWIWLFPRQVAVFGNGHIGNPILFFSASVAAIVSLGGGGFIRKPSTRALGHWPAVASFNVFPSAGFGFV